MTAPRNEMALESRSIASLLAALATVIGLEACDHRLKEYGAYSIGGYERLPDYAFEREALDCYQMKGLSSHQLQAEGVEVDLGTLPELDRPDLLVRIADPSIAGNFRYAVEASDTHVCGCGKCARHLWQPSRTVETSIRPLGDGYFRITTPVTLKPGIHMLTNDATNRAFVFIKVGNSTPGSGTAGSTEPSSKSLPAGHGWEGITRAALSNAIVAQDVNLIARAKDRPVIDSLDQSELTPLMEAIEARKVRSVRALLENGADPRVVASGLGDAFGGGVTALALAVSADDHEMVKLLLDHGGDPNSLGVYGSTVLGFAMQQGSRRIVNHLVSAGARLTPTSDMLAAAAGGGFIEYARRLLAAGVDVNTGGGYKGATTPLIAAAFGGHLGIVELLLAAAANIDFVDGASDRTALAHAAGAGHTAVVKRLLLAGASVEGASTGNMVEPPLHVAAGAGKNKVVSLLLAAGADPREVFLGRTALEVAREAKHDTVVRTIEGAMREH